MKDLTEFDPKVEYLHSLIVKTKEIQTLDPNDKEQFALVHNSRMMLVRERGNIEKTRKVYVEDALNYQRAVNKKAKELVEIIEEEEKRLHQMEKYAEVIILTEKRRALLPERVAKLALLNHVEKDEVLLGMDDAQFESYYNSLVSEFNEKKRLALEEDRLKLERQKEEFERKEREAIEEKERAEKARQEGIFKDRESQLFALGFLLRGTDYFFAHKVEVARAILTMHDDEGWNATLKNITEAVENAKKEIEEEQQENIKAARLAGIEEERNKEIARQEKEKKEEEAARLREKQEQEQLEAKKKYQNFLAKNGYIDDGSFIIENNGTMVTLYKKIATMKI